MKKGGFTLIEVVVAMAIVGISLVMVMQLFSGGLRAARASCDYTIGIVHAKDKMEEVSETLASDSGEFDDGFKWESNVENYKELEGVDYTLKKLKVKIIWPDALKNQKSIEMVSLKTIPNEK